MVLSKFVSVILLSFLVSATASAGAVLEFEARVLSIRTNKINLISAQRQKFSIEKSALSEGQLAYLTSHTSELKKVSIPYLSFVQQQGRGQR